MTPEAVSLPNDGPPVPLHQIPRGSYVLVSASTWLRLESWTVLDRGTRADAARFMVAFTGVARASMFHSEPCWPVWSGDGPPSAAVLSS